MKMQLCYRPLIAWLRRLFQNPALARLATYHANNRSALGDLCDFQDGSLYVDEILNDPRFAEDARNIFGALAADGLQPYADDAKYSMWPIVFTPYNFPPHIRYLLGLTTVICVIPGSRQPSSRISLQYVLGIVRDEFELLSYGVRLQDASKPVGQQSFLCRMKLVQVGVDRLASAASTHTCMHACSFFMLPHRVNMVYHSNMPCSCCDALIPKHQ
jgi:hypothetical protein